MQLVLLLFKLLLEYLLFAIDDFVEQYDDDIADDFIVADGLLAFVAFVKVEFEVEDR